MNMIRFTFFVFLLIAAISQPSSSLNAQGDTLGFPHTWQGIWQGELNIYQASGATQSIPMELHILPLENSDRFSWAIIYGEDKEAGKRPYELMVVDAEKGHYAIDEKNSIILDSYLIHDTFISRFEVQNNLLSTKVRKEGDRLIFEIAAGKGTSIRNSGGLTVKKEVIPEVQSFPIGVIQRAVLSRID